MEMRTRWSAAGSERGRTAGDWTWQMSCPTDFVAGIRGSRRGAEKPDGHGASARCGRTATTKIAYGVRRKHLLGGHLRRADELPLPDTPPSTYLLGGDAGRLPFRPWRPCGRTIPPFAFYYCHELPGHPRHPPHPHSCWGWAPQKQPKPLTLCSPQRKRAGAEAPAPRLCPFVHLPRRPHPLLRR